MLTYFKISGKGNALLAYHWQRYERHQSAKATPGKQTIRLQYSREREREKAKLLSSFRTQLLSDVNCQSHLQSRKCVTLCRQSRWGLKLYITAARKHGWNRFKFGAKIKGDRSRMWFLSKMAGETRCWCRCTDFPWDIEGSKRWQRCQRRQGSLIQPHICSIPILQDTTISASDLLAARLTSWRVMHSAILVQPGLAARYFIAWCRPCPWPISCQRRVKNR